MSSGRVSRVRGSRGSGKAVVGRAKSSGLKFIRRLTTAGKDPFDEVDWDTRSAIIVSEKGETIFKQENLEIPKPWSQVATNVVASKYFRGPDRSGKREHSVRQIIARVVQSLVEWGSKDGYFATERDAEVFDDELRSIILNPMYAKMSVLAIEPRTSVPTFMPAAINCPVVIFGLALLTSRTAVATAVAASVGVPSSPIIMPAMSIFLKSRFCDMVN